jgi:uncharacterized protein YktB (UPF0637 family)
MRKIRVIVPVHKINFSASYSEITNNLIANFSLKVVLEDEVTGSTKEEYTEPAIITSNQNLTPKELLEKIKNFFEEEKIEYAVCNIYEDQTVRLSETSDFIKKISNLINDEIEEEIY